MLLQNKEEHHLLPLRHFCNSFQKTITTIICNKKSSFRIHFYEVSYTRKPHKSLKLRKSKVHAILRSYIFPFYERLFAKQFLQLLLVVNSYCPQHILWLKKAMNKQIGNNIVIIVNWLISTRNVDCYDK